MEIIIVTYNGMQWLPKCLDSCKKYSVTIVDNGSTDGTLNFIETNHPNITLLKQDKNLGFGQGNNLGIRQALDRGAAYVFLLNQDAYLQEGCIETLLALHKKNPEYGILSPIHLNGKGNRLDRNFSNYLIHEHNADFYSDFVLDKPLDEVYDVPFVNAAGWLMSRKILETVGGFDPIFFHYGEDDNYCQRARYHNFKIGVVPSAFMYHDREERELDIKSNNPLGAFERNLKKRYADLNTENLNELKEILRSRKKGLIKTFIKLSFSQLADVRDEIRLIEKVLRELGMSREKNKAKGRHYL